MPIAKVTPVSQKISFRPLTFLFTGKPVRPVRAQAPNRTPGRRGIQISGNDSYGEFVRSIRSINQPSVEELGRGATKLMNALGSNVNIRA